MNHLNAKHVFACLLAIPLVLNLWMAIKLYHQHRASPGVAFVASTATPLSKICDKLVAGDKDAIEVAKETKSYNIISDETYVTLTKNCQIFTKTRGYVMHPLSVEETNFPLAYSILMYKDVCQAERLLRALYYPQNYYIIHLDPRATQVVKDAIKGIVNCFPNVFEAQNPLEIKWGQFSLLQAELTCMRQLLSYKKWKYFINLTGQEFPLWSNRDIVRTLMAFKGANNIEGKLNK
jgi:hypothetical protein